MKIDFSKNTAPGFAPVCVEAVSETLKRPCAASDYRTFSLHYGKRSSEKLDKIFTIYD
jgi:hypothetical protein